MSNDAAGKETWAHTFKVAFILCAVCSILVSAAAVLLRPLQNANKERERKKNILIAAGLYDETKRAVVFKGRVLLDDDRKRKLPIEAMFQPSKTRPYVDQEIIDLKTGEPIGADTEKAIADKFGAVDKYDQRRASRDPDWSSKIEATGDVARLKRREHYSWVYYVRKPNGELEQIILPIRGYGLWSTLWGFIALKADLTTIRGITYYEHGETPGLGGEVDNPLWKELWRGKKAFGESGKVQIHVIKGVAPKDAVHQIDGLSGATITSKGVTNMLKFWLGEEGFGPFLERMRNKGD
ncbi:MAG: Na(+)-translocating NADH-quinone reductase subunit C [Planctomycetaceae bacterium]